MILDTRLAEVTATLNRLPFVRWDRAIDTPDQLDVYGWIARGDGRSDFVVVTFVSWADAPGYVTSSAARDAEIAVALAVDGAESYPCKRVEVLLPEVKNATRL